MTLAKETEREGQQLKPCCATLLVEAREGSKVFACDVGIELLKTTKVICIV